MSLDRKNSNVYYLIGRLVAVVERSNGKELSASQKDNIIANPSLITRYDMKKSNMLAERNEIYNLLPAEGIPTKMGPVDAGRFWVGYYHQNSAMPETEVYHHEPERVIASGEHIVKELKK